MLPSYIRQNNSYVYWTNFYIAVNKIKTNKEKSHMAFPLILYKFLWIKIIFYYILNLILASNLSYNGINFHFQFSSEKKKNHSQQGSIHPQKITYINRFKNCPKVVFNVWKIIFILFYDQCFYFMISESSLKEMATDHMATVN